MFVQYVFEWLHPIIQLLKCVNNEKLDERGKSLFLIAFLLTIISECHFDVWNVVEGGRRERHSWMLVLSGFISQWIVVYVRGKMMQCTCSRYV